jgi:hypothetical protein
VTVTIKVTAIIRTIDTVRKCIVTSQLAGTAYRRMGIREICVCASLDMTVGKVD